MSSITSSNLTSGFIDLATFDETEKYLYGGPTAIAYFVKETRKSTWFTLCPVVLSRASGQPQFNQEWSVTVSRSGDYLLNTWLRVTLPSVTLSENNQFGEDGRLRWCRNALVSLIRETAISFNDLIAARMDNFWLEMWAHFCIPAGKKTGYNNMVGNIAELVQPRAANVPIPSVTLNLPLPYFFTRDSGCALPTAALPYNEIRLNFAFRGWQDLLILDQITGPNSSRATTAQLSDLASGEPQLQSVQVWGTYAIVSNDERRRMGCSARDLLVEQVQTAPIQNYSPLSNASPSFDIRFSHAIKAIFFAARNKTCPSEWGNYTAASPVVRTPTVGGPSYVDFTPSGAVDPIAHTSLVYENSPRLTQMGSDYFSLIQPFYHCPCIPLETGLHVFSYALDVYSLEPLGSTNYGKLTNVSIIPTASKATLTPGEVGSGNEYEQKFDFLVLALSWNIIRISGKKLAAANSRLPCRVHTPPAWANSGRVCVA